MIKYSGGGQTFWIPELPTKIRDTPTKRGPVPRNGHRDEPHTVYRAYAEDGSLVYVGMCRDLDSRISNHRCTSWWWDGEVYRVTYQIHPDWDEAHRVEVAAIKEGQPTRNDRHNPEYRT